MVPTMNCQLNFGNNRHMIASWNVSLVHGHLSAALEIAVNGTKVGTKVKTKVGTKLETDVKTKVKMA